MSEPFGSEGFQPRNELEIELVRAAHEPGFRPTFLRELVGADVYLALLLGDGGRIDTGPNGEAVIPLLMRNRAEREGRRALPFFSSPVRAQEFYRQDHVIAPEKARDLLARHAGTAFVLNPGSAYALDLDETDVAAMLRGDFTAH